MRVSMSPVQLAKNQRAQHQAYMQDMAEGLAVFMHKAHVSKVRAADCARDGNACEQDYWDQRREYYQQDVAPWYAERLCA